VIVEVAVERYRFRCRNCGHTWTADYDVQYLRDYEGDEWAFYRLDGVPVPAPALGDHLCPVCGHGNVFVELIARRDVPVASLGSDEPRNKVTESREARRNAAPRLAADDRSVPEQVFVALQRDARDDNVVGVFRELSAAFDAFGEPDRVWKETSPGRWSDGAGLRVERHRLV
jgi:hypothetical protein